MPAPGPPEFGRGVIINHDDPTPAAWKDAEVIPVEGPKAIDALHRAWSSRCPVVIRLLTDPSRWRTPETVPREPWQVAPDLDLASDRLHHLLWANNYDARGGVTPQWWWSRKASRLGAIETPEGPTDIRLTNGQEVWIDGGPRGPLPGGLAYVHAESVDLGSLRVAPAPVDPHPEIPLAADQIRAVAHGSGPARIIAPAGSGKTRVLTERLRHLLGERHFEREIVCAVTYNRRAQEELARRCAAFRPRVVTLNALGWELLGRPPVLDERETRRIIEGLVPKPTRRANVDPIGPYLEALSTIRLGLVDPLEVEDARDDVPGVAEAFLPYRSALRAKGAVDFDEQIYGAIEHLLVDGDFRRRQQMRHRHLLVDEFQDLTPAHVLMLRLLAMPGLDVFGVGDDDQVIYGHAGADPSFLLEFGRLFPHAESHPLEVNYRCRPEVVDAARSLLRHNRRRIEKTIRSDRAPGKDSLRVVLHPTRSGAVELVNIIRSHIDSGRPGSEIAVLTRVNSTLLAPQVALKEAGLRVEGGLDERVLARTGVRAALAYLRIATNPDGFAVADLTEVLRRPSRGLPQWIDRWFRGTTMTVAQLRRISSNLDDAKVSAKVDGLADDLDQIIRVARRGTTRDILRSVKNDIGLGQAMTLLDASASGSHLDDLEALEQVADLHPEASGFEPWLREVLGPPKKGPVETGFTDEPVAPTAPNAGPNTAWDTEWDLVRDPTRVIERDRGGITLATVHKVKGQEWPVVVLFGVTDGLMPHRLSTDEEEERRVLHVGITRGIEHVVILGDAARPSPFLAELDPTATPRPTPTSSSSSKSAHTGRAEPATARSRPTGTAATVGLRKVGPGIPNGPVDETLLEQLRVWRTSRAKADGVPPYVVMHDKHLQGLAASRPRDLLGLARVDGMGPRRLELYADDLLALFTETPTDSQ